MAEYAKYSKASPQWTQFVASQPLLTDLDRVGIVERKRTFIEIEFQIPVRDVPDDITSKAVTVTEFTIPARDGYALPVRSYVPTTARPDGSPRPLLIYLHAGGFLFGDLDSGDLNCRVLAVRLNISVLNVGYRLAPKWPFPTGVNDSYDATAWAGKNAESHLAASPSAGFLVGGISSGANFAGVIAYTARDAGLSPPITGLFVSIPVCIMPQAYAAAPPEWTEKHLLSLEQNAENPLLTRKSLTDIQELYGCPPEDTRISFLLNKGHSGLPGRAYFQICGRDPLRDEAFLWQKLLKEYSGTKSKIHVYSGQPHGFWRFLQMEVSRGWLDDVVEGIAFLIQGEEPVHETEMVVKA
ncbi:Alpha/Beta hydrolase protein [Aspergillus cavernicola]|uniref:Alpha/Beta hydrolase protein n=1 Tax=Aspergillus cavernicola TaxID=176166 RepID=A0ABR4I230_9EURO